MSHSPRRPGARWVAVGARCALLAFTLTLTLLFSACTARVTGYQSPIAHDYAAIAWQPLASTISQPFVAGTGYSDAVANDPKTTPEQFQARMAALPADAREGTLRELRVGARLSNDQGTQWQWRTGARAQLVYVPELDTRWPERDFHAWPTSQRWLDELAGPGVVMQEFVSPYPLLSGVTVRIATFGADLSAGQATVGPFGAGVLALPVDGAPVGTLAAGQTVTVTSALEGWAQVQLPDGVTGFAPLAAFATLPPPARQVGGALRAVLRDAATGTSLREARVPAEQLRDNSHLDLRFDSLPDSLGRRYRLELSMPDAQPGGGITLRALAAAPSACGASCAMVGAFGSQPINLVFRPLYAAAPPLLDVALDDLPRDGDWLRVTRPPNIAAGTVVALQMTPGNGPDAPRLEYGLTSDRVPYGGWFGRDAAGAALTGALLVSTRYDRDVALMETARAGLRRLRSGARGDLAFAVLYSVALGGLLVCAGRLAFRGRRAARRGR